MPDGERWAAVKSTEPDPETVISLHWAAEQIRAAHGRGERCASCQPDHCIDDAWATVTIHLATLRPVGPFV
jgi:hypothetical protein